MKWFLISWIIIGLIIYISEWPKVDRITILQRIVFFLVVGPLGWTLMSFYFVENWRDIVGDLLLFIFCWSGSKLFGIISIFSPDDKMIDVVHFSRTEEGLRNSCKKLLEELDETE